MAAKIEYIEGTTKSGFDYKIEKDALDDWELVEAISQMDGPTGSVKFIQAFLGDKQYAALKEHCRNERGRVKASQMEKEVTEILNANKPTKK